MLVLHVLLPMAHNASVTSAVAKVTCMSTEWDVTQPHFSYETDGSVSGTVFFVRGKGRLMTEGTRERRL